MLDHGIARMLQAMHDDGEPPLFVDHDATLARRRGVEIRGRYYPPVRLDVATVEETAIPGPAGPRRARIYRPPAPTGATVVFFHGGGWIIGDLDSHDGHARPAGRHRRRFGGARRLPTRSRESFPGSLSGLHGGDRVGPRPPR